MWHVALLRKQCRAQCGPENTTKEELAGWLERN